jgi:hypothetical protein
MEDGQTNVNVNGGGGDGSAGPIIGIIVILAIIILGGLYFWGQRADDMIDESNEPVIVQPENDDTSSIEADLESTDVDNMDADLNAS